MDTYCWFCGSKMNWESDFNAEDYGYESEGIVAVLHCPNCGADAKFTYIENNKEVNNE